MDDNEALLWDKSRRKRDIDDYEHHQIESKILATDSDKVSDTPMTSDDKMIDKPSADVDESVSISKEEVQETVDNEKKFTNEEIHAKLKAIDPVMAGRLHVNNRRKVLR